MNLILIDPHEPKGNTVTLVDRRHEHIRKVLRGKEGDSVRIGLINGPMGTGTILEITGNHVVLSLAVDGPSPPQADTDLILALPRPIMLKRVLAQAASLGVARIFLIKANRVEKSFFHSSLLKSDALRDHLLYGLEQAIDTRVPEVSIHTRFKPFVEDLVPKIIEHTAVRLAAHPEAGHCLLEAAPPPLKSRAIVAIGPEGGWVDFEIEKLRQQGFIPFSLGRRILRVDTAVPALLSQLSLLRRL